MGSRSGMCCRHLLVQNFSALTFLFPAAGNYYNHVPLLWSTPLTLPHDWCHHTKGLPLFWVIPLAIWLSSSCGAALLFVAKLKKARAPPPIWDRHAFFFHFGFGTLQSQILSLGCATGDPRVTHLLPPILGPKIWAHTGAP